eukprot:1090130-Rhodomonas_salina.4
MNCQLVDAHLAGLRPSEHAPLPRRPVTALKLGIEEGYILHRWYADACGSLDEGDRVFNRSLWIRFPATGVLGDAFGDEFAALVMSLDPHALRGVTVLELFLVLKCSVD